MKLNSRAIVSFLTGDVQADRIVPPTGFTAQLTIFVSGAMAFLVVFALALSLATGRLAERWGTELAQSATVRITAPQDQMAAQTTAAMRVLETTAGVETVRVLSLEEQQVLLAPWFGPDVPLADLPVPQLIEVVQENPGYDAAGLRLRLQAEAPGAVLDDHTRWRAPLVHAADRLRLLGWVSIFLIGFTMAAMITLAANAALAANAQLIAVLRLVGAKDNYIAKAFVRRFTLRAFVGAAAGMALGLAAVFLLPSASDEGGFLTGLGYQGWHWLLPMVIPFAAAAVAFGATRFAAQRTLAELA